MKHCPVCESSLTEQPVCPRCGSDLSLLQTIQAQSRQHLIVALQSFIKGDQIEANQQLHAARQLNNDQLTVSIECLLSPAITRQNSFLESIARIAKLRVADILKQIREAGFRVVAKCYNTKQ